MSGTKRAVVQRGMTRRIGKTRIDKNHTQDVLVASQFHFAVVTFRRQGPATVSQTAPARHVETGLGWGPVAAASEAVQGSEQLSAFPLMKTAPHLADQNRQAIAIGHDNRAHTLSAGVFSCFPATAGAPRPSILCRPSIEVGSC